jgi:FkbM family methyltransferase
MTAERPPDQTAPLYDCSPNLHAGTLDSLSMPITFETKSPAWSYVVSFKRSPSPARSGPVIVRVTLDVLAGELAVGVLKGDGQTYIDEVVVGVGPQRVADILVADPAAAGELMVRNGSVGGESRGRILAIESFALTLDAAAAREPGLSFPQPTPRWNRAYGTDLSTPVEKLRALAFESLTSPEVVRWSDGLSFRIVPNDQISRVLYVSGTYEPNALHVLQRFLQAGHVFLDVGANAGVFSLVASRAVGSRGHVYSFEPSEREYRRLSDAVQLNHLDGVITAIRAAIGAHRGEVSLRVASEPYSGHNTLGSGFAYEDVGTSKLERVEMTTLDDFDRREGLSRIDVIKLDIEGAEAAALVGAERVLRTRRPVLIIEVFSRSLSSSGASAAEIQERLLNADYRLFTIDDETAALTTLDDLTSIDEQNVVAVPAEKVS